MDPQDLQPARTIRPVDQHLAVEAAGPQQGRIEHLRSIGGADQDHAGHRIEPVELSEQLVECLLLLVVATERAGATAAAERIVAGLEKKSRVLGQEERRRVAYHEMGHALVAASLPGVDPVHKVSIIPRGVGALGYTMQRPTEDRFLLARHDLANRIAVLMGGRASEALIFDGEVSTGAADDLQRATEIALHMVTRFGMDETVGQRTYSAPPQPFLGTQASGVEASERTEREIDVAVRDIISKAFEQATTILRTRRADLDEGSRLLLAQETLTADQFPAIRPVTKQPETAG